MQILGHLCLLITVCSFVEFYRRFLICLMDCVTFLKHLDLNFDFGFGFLVFGCLGQIFKVLGLFLLFALGLKVLQFSWFCKSSELRCGCCSRDDFEGHCGSKTRALKSGLSRSLKNGDRLSKIEMLEGNTKEFDVVGEFCDANDEEINEGGNEDEVFDILSLRKMVKIERRKAKSAHLELEKERMASASAAEEAMAMILRLQNERSVIEMESKQYKRLAEEKQLHDQEVIQSLQWLVSKHESESAISEDQLRWRRKRSKLFARNGEGDHSEDEELPWSLPNANFEDVIHRRLFSSLDLDLSLE